MKLLRTRAGLSSILWLLIAAFFIRTLFACLLFLARSNPDVFFAVDTPPYLDAARSFLSFGTMMHGTMPMIYRPPGYSIFLLVPVLLGHVILSTVCLQLILSVCTVYMVFLIGRDLIGNRGGLLAASLYACEPLSVLYVSRILSETLFTFCWILFVFCFLRLLRAQEKTNGTMPSMWRYLGLGSVLAATTYIRPTTYFLPLLLPLPMAVSAFHSRGIHKNGNYADWIKRGFALIGSAALFIGLWQVRNRILTGYTGFASVQDGALYFKYAARIVAEKEGTDTRKIAERWGYGDEELFLKLHPEQRTWTQAERSKFLRNSGLTIIMAERWTYAKIHFRELFHLLFATGGREILDALHDPWAEQTTAAQFVAGFGDPKLFVINLFTVVPLIIILLLAAFGCFSLEWKRPDVVTLGLLVGYLLLVSAQPDCEPRYRHPIMPLFCVFAGAVLTSPTKGSSASR